MVLVSALPGTGCQEPAPEPPNRCHQWLLDTTGRGRVCPKRSRTARAGALRPHGMQGAAAQGDRGQPGHAGIGHPAPPPPAARIPWDGSAAGTALSTRVRLLRSKCCGAEAAPSLHPCISASLLTASPDSPSPGTPVAPPAQSRAVLLPWARGAVGTGVGTGHPGDNASARVSLPPALLRALCEAAHTGQLEPGEWTRPQGPGICAIRCLASVLRSLPEGRRPGCQPDSVGFSRKTPAESPKAKLLLWVYRGSHLVFYTNAIFLLCNAQGHA